MRTSNAILLILLFILAYIVICEILTILFRLTGMPAGKSRFQVISLMTNCGYTTSESELVAMERIRRRLAMVTMIIGYMFAVIIVSMLLNLIMALPTTEAADLISTGAYVLGFVLILFVLIRVQKVRMWFDNHIRDWGAKLMFRDRTHPIQLLDTYGEKVIAELLVTDLPPLLQDKTIAETQMRRKYGIQILVIRREGNTISHVSPEEQVCRGDSLVVYGGLAEIQALFQGQTEPTPPFVGESNKEQ